MTAQTLDHARPLHLPKKTILIVVTICVLAASVFGLLLAQDWSKNIGIGYVVSAWQDGTSCGFDLRFFGHLLLEDRFDGCSSKEDLDQNIRQHMDRYWLFKEVMQEFLKTLAK